MSDLHPASSAPAPWLGVSSSVPDPTAVAVCASAEPEPIASAAAPPPSSSPRARGPNWGRSALGSVGAAAVAVSVSAWVVSAAFAAAPAAVPGTPSPRPAGAEASALVLHADSIARRQLVAVGRDLEVHGEARADAVALDGSVWVTGSVDGDVVVLGGDAHLAGSARVGGDVYVVGGVVEVAPGAEVAGRSVSYPEASAAWLTLVEGPALGVAASSPLVLGGKLALLAAWLALVIAFFAASGRQVLSTSQAVRDEPWRCFATGVVGVLALVLTALLFSAFAAALVGVPLLALAVLFSLVLKLWGMVAVFHALGEAVARHAGRRPGPLNAATLGLALLGLLKLVPYLGLWVWSAATFLGVGAALHTKFGRREPWFDTGAADPARLARV
jgi:hypothetical protein